jgi:hypothetical protein
MKYNINIVKLEDIEKFLQFKKTLGLDFKTIAEHLERTAINGFKTSVKLKRVKPLQLRIIRDKEFNRLKKVFSLSLKEQDIEKSFKTLSKLTYLSNRRINKLLGKISGNSPLLTLDNKKEVIEKRVAEIVKAFKLIEDI